MDIFVQICLSSNQDFLFIDVKKLSMCRAFEVLGEQIFEYLSKLNIVFVTIISFFRYVWKIRVSENF